MLTSAARHEIALNVPAIEKQTVRCEMHHIDAVA